MCYLVHVTPYIKEDAEFFRFIQLDLKGLETIPASS
jgi:hypothetical protein